MSVEQVSQIATLSPLVVAFLATYFKDIVGGSAKHIGSEITEKVQTKGKQIYDLVKVKLHGTPAGAEALTDLEKTPDDEDTQASVRLQLKKVLEKEPDLLTQLQEMLKEAKAESGTSSFVVNNHAPVTNQANVKAMHGGSLFNKSE